MNYNFDFIIVGGGPCGLTLAYYLSKNKNNKILLIDSNDSLGGCHRVKRSYEFNLFTEHGPRIYSSSYVNFRALLDDMNLNFFDLFIEYDFKLMDTVKKSLSIIKKRELTLFAKEYIKLIFNQKSSKFISMEDFCNKNNFTDKTKDYLDRLCRLTDGAGIDRTSLFQFLQLLNQHFFYKIYQPNKPNDIQLFKLWEEKLISNGVTIWKNSFVSSITINTVNNDINHIIVIKNQKEEKLFAKNFIFAIPPKFYYNLIIKSNLQQHYPGLNNIVQDNNYIVDIPVTFHWKSKIILPKIWGLTDTDWGLAFVVLSNYMDLSNEISKTLISTCITRIDSKSNFTNKTANETTDKNEFIEEVFRQLKLTYPELPKPDFSILNPNVTRDKDNWMEKDTAYVSTYKQQFYPYNNKNIKNLFFVGTHNGHSNYSFTSLESALQNALHFLNFIGNKTNIKKGLELTTLIRVILVIIILLFIKKYFLGKS